MIGAAPTLWTPCSVYSFTASRTSELKAGVPLTTRFIKPVPSGFAFRMAAARRPHSCICSTTGASYQTAKWMFRP